MQKKLFLLDAMALIYRAYYAMVKSPRITSKGVNTSATLGFTNTLYEVLRQEQPTHIAVAFDTGDVGVIPVFARGAGIICSEAQRTTAAERGTL